MNITEENKENQKWYTDEYLKEYNKVKKSLTVTIEKYNRNGRLCYSDFKDLTGLDFTQKQKETLKSLFENAGFTVTFRESSYIGVYDPVRFGGFIEIYPTDKELLEQDIRKIKLDHEIDKIRGRTDTPLWDIIYYKIFGKHLD